MLSALSKLIFAVFKNPNLAEISDMEWAQHINIDYAQNLKKDPEKAKKDLTKFLQGALSSFCSPSILGICSNFI